MLFRSSPIHYQDPGSTSRSPSGQTILFGCPIELRTIGELMKIPPVLEYLLDSVLDWPSAVGQKRKICTTDSPCSKMEDRYRWPLVNELEQAWTGVEESDRAIISNFAQQGNHTFLIMVCLVRCAILKAKRHCRNTFGPCQSQY